jgi:rieske iron-sulfur protein
LGSIDDKTGRRDVLKVGVGLGIQVGLAGALTGQGTPASVRPKEGDRLVKTNDSSATPLTPADIPLGERQTMAWAVDPVDNTVRSGSRLNRVLLVSLDPSKLSTDTKARAADGVLAYTAICTHTGCDVSEWFKEDQTLFCPCHDSKYDPKDGAKVLDGPAPRPLPALPLKIVDGKLVVAKGFTSTVGFEAQ